MRTINLLRFRESLISRLVVTFLLLSIVPTAVMGLISYFQGKGTIQSTLGISLHEKTELGTTIIKNWLSDETEKLEFISSHSDFRNPDNRGAILRQLKDAQQKYSGVRAFIWAWPNGEALASNGGIINVSDLDVFQNVINSRKTAVSSRLFTSKVTAEEVFSIGVPVFKGDVIGVLLAEYSSYTISRLLSSFLGHHSQNDSFYMVNKSGIIFGSTNPNILNKNVLTDFSQGEKGFFEASVKGEEGKEYGIATRDKGLSFVAYTSIPGTDWFLGIDTPFSKVSSGLNWLFRIFIITLIITVIVVIIIGYFMSLSIARPILELTETTNTLAQGDMTVPINTRYIGEVGVLAKSIARLVDNLSSLLITARDTATQASSMTEQVLGAANQTSQAIQQVSSTIQSVASGAQETARNMSDASGAVENISKKIEDLAQTASTVEQTAQDTIKLTQEGQDVVDELNRGFSQTTQATNSVVSSMDELEKAAGEIGRIVETITSISSQTNLLALNAAIEAARAGEAGRGFAVVADEVRKLAEESNQSAQRISQFIDQIRSQIANTAKNTEEAVKTISRQMEIGSRVVDAFREIDQATNKVVEIIQNITSGITGLVGDARTISQSVQGVAAIAQENAASSEEVSAATEEMTAAIEEITANINNLSELVKGLEEIIMRFKME
jgi:methyl-accepting chemotaxis protein